MKQKAKKGQILIFVLVVMVFGLIAITPLLYYLSATQKHYEYVLIDTVGYYSADAMMEQVMSDLAAVEDVSALAASGSYTASPGLNGCKVNTSISLLRTGSLPPPEGDILYSEQYLDPGVGLTPDPLGNGDTYSCKVYLVEGSNVIVHWYFDDSRDSYLGDTCDYHCNGEMWLTYENSTPVLYSSGSPVHLSSSNTNTAFNQSLSWTVPVNMSGNYYINFKQNSYRLIVGAYGYCDSGKVIPDRWSPGLSLTNCDDTQTITIQYLLAGTWWPLLRTINTYACASPYSGTGAMDHTWVRVNTSYGGQAGQYADYAITTTARDLNDKDIVSITAYVRQTPGPSLYQDPQDIQIISWQITYY
jgi:hypothetical protein